MTEKMNKRQNEWSKILVTIIGTFIMGAGVNLVFEPMNMVVGGLSGFAIIVKNLTSRFIDGGIPIWLTTAILNVPLFLAAWKVKGSYFVKRTLFATISFTFALYIIPTYDVARGDGILAAVIGGVLSGAGLGLVFRNGGSTGGTDLLGAILNHFFPNYSVANMLLAVDSTIIALGASIFGINMAMYAIIAAYVTTKVMDSVLEGVKFAKLAYIISDKPEKVSQHVMEGLDRGVTFIKAEGGYTNEQKRMIMCVVSNKQIATLKGLVKETDSNAFLIISDAREVFGEGFIENDY